ncbi:MAG: NAD(P)H-binding protein [Chloroflexota bacterium]
MSRMILITGATGFIGRHLVRRLLRHDYRVRCLIPEYKLRDFKWNVEEDGPAPEVVVGTLLDEEVIYRAVTGIHTVIHLESAQWWGNERDLERVDLTGTRKLVEAARSARVGRIVVLSHLGATTAAAYPLMRVKGAVEDVVRSSGLAFTILRSGVVFGEEDSFCNHIAMLLFSNPFIFLMPGRGEVVLHPIYIGDLITLLEQTLENMDTVDQVIEVGGPEYITLIDLIRTVMRVSGRYRMIIPVPPYVFRWINRGTRVILRRTLLTPQWLDLLATNRAAQLGTVTRYFDIRLRRLEDTMLTYMPRQNSMADALRYLFRRRPQRL